MLILQNKDFHEFVLTILPQFLFTTFMDYRILFLFVNFHCVYWVTLSEFLGAASYTAHGSLRNVQLYPTLPIFMSCCFRDVILIE